jgi:hypothetical protein
LTLPGVMVPPTLPPPGLDHPASPGPSMLFYSTLDWRAAGRPAAAAHVRRALKPDGSWMIVEPMAGDSVEQNLNPVSRLFYVASTMVCIPTSRSQEAGAALGAQAGVAKLRETISAGGFTSVRRAAETPFNLILEARP